VFDKKGVELGGGESGFIVKSSGAVLGGKRIEGAGGSGALR